MNERSKERKKESKEEKKTEITKERKKGRKKEIKTERRKERKKEGTLWIQASLNWSVGSLSGEQLRIWGVAWILSLQSRAPFAGFISQKCSETDLQKKNMRNRALVAFSCAFCRPHLPKVPRPPQFLRFFCEISLLHFSGTFCQRTGFCPESVFKPEFTRSRSLTLPNCLHDDVVASWGESQPWPSFVIRNFPN